MLLASKSARAGIVFILLTTGISGPRAGLRSLREQTSAKKCQRSRIGTMSRRCRKLDLSLLQAEVHLAPFIEVDLQHPFFSAGKLARHRAGLVI